MKNIIKKNSIKILIGLFVLILIHCDFITNRNNNENVVKIDFPINKTCIYISASFLEKDTLALRYIDIYTLQYDSSYNVNDTTYFIGTTRKYSPYISEQIGEVYIDTGKIVTSIDKSWVNIQYYEILSTELVFFLKTTVVSTTDTTSVPTENHLQIPVYPSEIEPFQEYSVYRPKGANIYYEMTRYFETDNFVEWSDNYSTETGINIELISSDNLFFNAIIDNHGIIISQKTYLNRILMDEYGNILDSVNIHYINRRVEDFTNPNSIHVLSYYSDLVKENGVQFIERNPE